MAGWFIAWCGLVWLVSFMAEWFQKIKNAKTPLPPFLFSLTVLVTGLRVGIDSYFSPPRARTFFSALKFLYYYVHWVCKNANYNNLTFKLTPPPPPLHHLSFYHFTLYSQFHPTQYVVNVGKTSTPRSAKRFFIAHLSHRLQGFGRFMDKT